MPPEPSKTILPKEEVPLVIEPRIILLVVVAVKVTVWPPGIKVAVGPRVQLPPKDIAAVKVVEALLAR